MAQLITRKNILTDAIGCVCNDREVQYGDPEDNFYRIAKLWNAYLGDNVVDEVDVAMMMALLKVARAKTGRNKADNFVDLAGYAACAGEIALKGLREDSHNPELLSGV